MILKVLVSVPNAECSFELAPVSLVLGDEIGLNSVVALCSLYVSQLFPLLLVL
jgi:hypothetical protein